MGKRFDERSNRVAHIYDPSARGTIVDKEYFKPGDNDKVPSTVLYHVKWDDNPRNVNFCTQDELVHLREAFYTTS